MPHDHNLLETFPNPHPDRAYEVYHRVREFTSLCPITGQPDFAEIRLRYCAAERCIELKSLKLYLQGFRDEGMFYEDATNVIINELAACCLPRWMRIETRWNVRGGIHSTIIAEVGKKPPDAPSA
jgi:7-cyano-7-deazaguanine reductase